MIRPLIAYSDRVAINEVKLIGREETAPLMPVIMIDPPLRRDIRGGNTTYEDVQVERAAEVINLERNVRVTGDHANFEQTKVGLHTIGAYGGIMRMTHTRVEYCGQKVRSHGRCKCLARTTHIIMLRVLHLHLSPCSRMYSLLSLWPCMVRFLTPATLLWLPDCIHMHHLSHCPECLIEGNAVEHMVEAGINVHDTHDSKVHRNVVLTTDKATGAFYVEDGNEINKCAAA